MEELLLFTVLGNNQLVPKVVKNYQEFVNNLIFRFEYDVWGADVDWDSFIIAGGAILSSLLVEGSNDSGSDIDLFFIKGNAQLFQTAVV